MNANVFMANLIVFVHLAYVGFVVVLVPVIVLGGLLKWKWVRNFWLRVVHFIMMGVVIVETVFGVTCPLTTWETNYRMAAGQIAVKRDELGNPIPHGEGYVEIAPTEAMSEDFVARCLRGVLFFPENVSQETLNLFYYGFGAMILITLFLVPPRWPWRKVKVQPATA
jgi:hypothetical protein